MWNIEESVIWAVQLAQYDFDGKDSIDAESNSELDEDINSEFCLHSITFEMDANGDITSLALCNMVAVYHSVKQLAALQMSISSCNIQQQILAQPDWDQ